MSGSTLNPSTETLLPQLLPESSRTSDDDTLVTPGSAASSCSRRSNSACARAGLYPLKSGETANVTTLSMFNPRSTRLTFIRLFVNSPADTSSAIDSAIWVVASEARNRAAVRVPDGWPA